MKLISRKLSISKHDILVVACVRNEILRIEDFFRHYNRIGVDKYLFIDNGSDDGTLEYLLSQSSAIVYSTQESYAANQCGVTWQNRLLEEYANGHWVIIVDADEHLTYPHSETISLSRLTAYIQKNNGQAMAAPMLDMYPRGPIAKTGYAQGESLLEHCRYFDANGYSTHSVTQSSFNFISRGGPRERLFWNKHRRDYPSPYLFKIPLVEWRSDLYLDKSTHNIDRVDLAEISGLLLHFKFLQDFPIRALEERERKEHFAEARQYAAYSDILQGAEEVSAFFSGSEQFESSTQMIKLGLMNKPSNFNQII